MEIYKRIIQIDYLHLMMSWL